MNRRKFLGLLAGSTTSYFFAPIGGWKSDLIANPHEMTVGYFNKDPRKINPEPMFFVSGFPYYHLPSTSGLYLGVKRT